MPAHRPTGLNRRQFLGNSATSAAGLAVGLVGWPATAIPANSRPLRVAVLGVRHRGGELLAHLAAHPLCQISVLCDVDEAPLKSAARKVAEMSHRHRPQLLTSPAAAITSAEVDAVVIATPDHTHAALANLAVEARRHVYLESPVTHTMAESRALQTLAAEAPVVMLSGLCDRHSDHVASAFELLQSGTLGDVRYAKAWAFLKRASIGHREATAWPAGLNAADWQGPHADARFYANRFHGNWRWFWDYGAGELGTWGVMLLDIARSGLALELPLEVTAAGSTLVLKDDRETPDTLSVHFQYPHAQIDWEHRQWTSHGHEGRSTGVAFYGTDGTLVLDRSGWKVYGRKDAPAAEATPALPAHLHRFLTAAIAGDTSVNGWMEQAILSSELAQLGNLAFRSGRPVRYDAPQSRIVGNPAAHRLAGFA